MNAALLGFASAVLVMIGLIALDAKATNLLVPATVDLSEVEEDIRSLKNDITGVKGEVRTLSTRRGLLADRISALEAADDIPDASFSLMIARFSSMWAIARWAELRPGTPVTSRDVRVVACQEYIFNGTGSGVECGFERAPE